MTVDKIAHQDWVLNDFFKLGRHTFLVSIFMTMMLLNQIGIIFFASFAGSTAKVVSCGDHDFSNTTDYWDACKMLKDVQEFDNCTPELTAQFNSLNLEYGYYCEGSKTVKQAITYQMIGMLIGAVVFGQISDSFGRKPTLLLTTFGANILNVAVSFTPSLFWFAVGNFFVHIFNAGGFAVLPIFALEMVRPKDRLWVSNLFGGNPVIILYSCLAYFCGEWRTLARASSALTIPAILLCLFISESPRYLIQKGKVLAAKKVLERIHKFDGRPFDENIVDHVLNKENQIFLEKRSEGKRYTFFHLFYTPNLTRYTISLAISFFVTSIIVFGIMFNIENIAGSIYMNLIFAGCVRYVIGALIAFMEIKFSFIGRKTIHMCIFAICTICLTTIFVVTVTGYQIQLAILLRIMAMTILGFLAQIYFLNSICVTELFPTSIRNLAYSFGALFNRMGIAIAPQIFFMATIWKPLPYLFMLCIVIFDMLFFHFNVQETKGAPLGDHMPGPEESWSSRRKNRKLQKLPESLANPDVAEKAQSQSLINSQMSLSGMRKMSERRFDRAESFISVSGI